MPLQKPANYEITCHTRNPKQQLSAFKATTQGDTCRQQKFQKGAHFPSKDIS